MNSGILNFVHRSKQKLGLWCIKMRRIDILTPLAKRDKTFISEEVLQISGLSKSSLKKVIYRLEQRGAIERIEKSKYMIIPLRAEKGKYTLNDFVIGSLLVTPSCIAYWSSLHDYGLTEQIPNTVFIQTTARKTFLLSIPQYLHPGTCRFG